MPAPGTDGRSTRLEDTTFCMVPTSLVCGKLDPARAPLGSHQLCEDIHLNPLAQKRFEQMTFFLSILIEFWSGFTLESVQNALSCSLELCFLVNYALHNGDS
jgi:hypothetical protein